MRRSNYAWVICIGTALLMFCNMGLAYNLFTYYFPFFVEEGLTNSQVSALFAVRSMAALGGTFMISSYIDKFGLRYGSVISVLCLSLSCVLFCCGRTYALYLIAAAFAGFSYCFGTVITTSLLIKNWFLKKKGLALGIASAGSSIVPVFFPSIVNYYIGKVGLHGTFLIEAGFTLVIAAILFLILRDTPQEIHLSPYGEGEKAPVAAKKPAGLAVTKSADCSMMAVMFLIGCSGAIFCGHMAVVMTSNGYSTEIAAQSIAMYGLMLLASKSIYGHCSDAWGALPATAVFILPAALSYFVPLLLDGSAALPCYIMMALFGIGSAAMVVGPPLWAYDFSAPELYEKNMRRYQISLEAGGVAFAALPGKIYDITGEYITSFLGEVYY